MLIYEVENIKTHHAKEVSGNAKHAQKSTEEGVAGFWEAVSHFLNLPTQSKFDALAMNMPLAMSEAEEKMNVRYADVRG